MPGQPAIYSFLEQYIPTLSSYNELFNPDNTIRPEWQTFFSSLHQLGYSELQTRNEDILRLLKENGVAYNIYNRPSGLNRPWELDPIPQIVTAAEWDVVNSGLVQRATLLDLLLKDIYGAQRLIRDGIIPQEVIYMHPGFLRTCVNIELTGLNHLVLYAADMARGMDGRLWVISDRTQAPSGAGYALENRFAMSSVLPELFHGLNLKRISPYFDTLQAALSGIASHNTDNPRIVILTPGPENETYFEHSYLAAYLGLTLVQGNDLMVKDNYVWLKTIDGLEKVDVILRRVDDVYCDPLELKSDSLLGVPGLVQAVRKKNVSIANPLGSSIVENAGLVPFLPSICKYFLSTELILPSIATWWCGQPREMNYVIEHINSLVIRKIFRNAGGGMSTTDGAALSKMETETLVRDIKENPGLYVGQEKVHFASAPSWLNDKIVAGHSLFRGFLVGHNNSYVAMPGGLTRTNTGDNTIIISNQQGGISKDTWVLSADDEQEKPVMLQLHAEPVNKKILKRSLPSHTAENLFWVGRYTERVIHNARLQRTVMQHILQSNKNTSADTASEVILLQALTQCTYSYPGFLDTDHPDLVQEKLENPWPELTDVLYNETRSGSLGQNIALLKQAVYSTRNFWSTDTWRVLRQMEDDWQKAKADRHADHLKMITTIDVLNTSMFAFLGMNRESVRREQGWNIMDMGRKLEQSLFLITLIQSVFQKKQDDPVQHDLLESTMLAGQSLITYRYTYRDHLQLPMALELLMLDINYPKSLAYLVEKIKRYISLLPNDTVEVAHGNTQRHIHEAELLLKITDIMELSKPDPQNDKYTLLQQFLEKLYFLLAETSTLVSKTYFKHNQVQKQLFTTNLL